MSLSATPDALAATTPMLAGRQAVPVNPKTKAALQDFESVLIGEMVNIMFSTVPTDELTGGGNAESIYRSMMGQEMGKQIARQGGLGLVPHLMNEVIRMQGGQA
ncbi:rod-binding protein [Pedomonas mirosovicensis]|uniref:rod-binding protein n=1 Tax=Pedomonas mirosovicensis TaxID=2908641 RepID=UPI002169AE29|nr:rod-binding protein [Pedomonas mirosovicensis]MCH8685097.1 rod-binding protein [Pedomonas mirosovicensis]